ncbi:hypothetical protein OSC52_15365 [Clostridium pasteurianum]|uniref:hypothetical protein n=1 Tax=Clostridium pasteurianum TaxID=1501 RepID=UPI002260D9BF|nr:hypothetical protein [Clostridium pasteurianum]UZW13215.1 hypothetical protein OSC52_15365 [Clostridium pasteurianum]
MKIYDIYEEPINKEIGNYKCEICGAIGKLILRAGKQFRYWYCECPNGHRPGIKKEIDDIFQIGDRIRIYHVPFGKNEKIDLSTYDEGLIIAKHKDIINYSLDMKIDRAVHQNKPIAKKSWVYGHIVRSISSDDNALELLTPQMKMII